VARRYSAAVSGVAYHVAWLCGIAIAICGIISWSWAKTRCLHQMDRINASISLSRSAGLLA